MSGSKPSGSVVTVKKINVAGRDALGASGGSNNSSSLVPVIHSNSTIERKPKKIVLQNQLPHTTGQVTKNNTQAPSPSNLNYS